VVYTSACLRRGGQGERKSLVVFDPAARESEKQIPEAANPLQRVAETENGSAKLETRKIEGKPGGKPERVSTKEASVP
jgi:hypothetical protein